MVYSHWPTPMPKPISRIAPRSVVYNACQWYWLSLSLGKNWPGNSSNPLKTSSSRSVWFLRKTFHFHRKIARTQGPVVISLNILNPPLSCTNKFPPVAGASVIRVKQPTRVNCHKWLQCLLDTGWTCRPEEAERNLWLWREPSHITIECLRRANIYSGNYTTLSRVTEKM